MHRTLLCTSTALAVLTCAAAASADSIVYIDHGNVWSATPDGARRVQLTDGGTWHSPTQSDDGTIAAVNSTNDITILSRDGRPLRTITTPTTRSANGDTFAPRPVQLSFSPDGRRIAYSYVAFSCVSGSTCGTAPQKATLITDATGPVATPPDTYGYNTGVASPEWLTNGRLVAWGGFGIGGALIDVPGARQGRVPWVEPEGDDVGDGEVSRDGKHVVSTAEYGANLHLRFSVTSGDPRTDATPSPITSSCDSDHDPSVADPSFSPDGLAVAFQESDGINVFRFRSITAHHCDLASSTVVLPGASEPDWGPADPPAARASGTPASNGPVSVPGPSPAPDPTPPPRPVPVPRPTDGRPGVIIGTSRATSTAIRRGLRVRVTVGQAGPVRVVLRRGTKTIATGVTTARRAGAVTVRLSRPHGAAARRMVGARLTLAVRAGATSANGRLRVSR